MKKIILTLSIVLTMVLGASAQDGFFRNGGSEESGARTSSSISGTMPALPSGYSVGANNNDVKAPLGSGLLILTALGAGYAISRKREN